MFTSWASYMFKRHAMRHIEMNADIWGLFLWMCFSFIYLPPLSPATQGPKLYPVPSFGISVWLGGIRMGYFEIKDSLLSLHLLILSTNSVLNHVVFKASPWNHFETILFNGNLSFSVDRRDFTAELVEQGAGYLLSPLLPLGMETITSDWGPYPKGYGDP